MDAIIALTLLVVIFAIIGLAVYGFCVLVARLAGRRPKGARRVCGFCRHSVPIEYDRCEICGREMQGPLAEELRDLDAVERQLRRFGDQGTLKPTAIAGFLARVKRYRAELLSRPSFRPASNDVARQPAAQPAAAATEEPVVAEVVAAVPEATTPPPETTPREPEPVAPTQQPREATPAPMPEPPPPRPSWGEMLAGFMQQRNIRWIELIAGLLIVGSSVVLVLSLWQTLGRLQTFQLAVSVAATSAVFGVGFYAQRRWRVESTSQSLLLIGTLLVPLNFLLGALASDGVEIVTVGANLIALGILGWLVGLAGRTTVPKGRWHQTVAVLGNSVVMLAIGWWISADSAEGWRLAVGCLPAMFFAGAMAVYLIADRKRSAVGILPENHTDEPAGDVAPNDDAEHDGLLRVNALFTLAGTAGFAMLVTLGLLVARAGGPLGYLCLPSVLAGVALLACGLTASRHAAAHDSLAAHQTAGTVVALVGAAGMLAAVALAWPGPAAMVGIGGLDAALFILAAFIFRMPFLHAGVIASGTVAYLTAFHAVDPRDALPWLAANENLGPQMLRLATGGSSGTALGGLFVVLALAAEWLARRGQKAHGAVYAGGCALVAVVGLMLVTLHGAKSPPDADALRAAILYAVYGAGSLALAARWSRATLSYLGLLLLTTATTWLLWWHTGAVQPSWAAALAGCGLLMAMVGTVLSRHANRPPSGWREQIARLRSGRSDSPLKMGATAGLSSSASENPPESHCWTSQQWHTKGTILHRASGDVFRLPLLHVAEIAALAALALGLVTGPAARQTPMLPLAASCLALLELTLAWVYGSRARTWIGSSLLLIGLVHTLALNYNVALGPDRPWGLLALLVHASVALAAAVVMDVGLGGRSQRSSPDRVEGVLGRPLVDCAMLSSILAALMLPAETAAGHMSLGIWAAALFWLAALWLVVAWRQRSLGLLAAHQIVLSMAVVVATAAWLERAGPWIGRLPHDLLLHPRSLQAYGIALGLLSLAWVVVRIAMHRSRARNRPETSDDAIATSETGESRPPTRATLLSPQRPAVDRAVRHGVVWLQGLLIVWCVLPGIAHELWPRATVPGLTLAATGREAWTLLIVMAVTMLATLWVRWRSSLTSSLLLAATVPWLVAGRFAVASHEATASALRWGAAVAFVVCSIALWQRGRLYRMATKLGAKIDVGRVGPRAARATLLCTTVAPVLALTVAAAILQLIGVASPGPAAASFFRRLAPSVSYLVPLLLVVAGLVGHAIRERSTGYAFAAGMAVKLAVGLGYALHVVTTNDGIFGATQIVVLVQLLTITAAAWALAWMAVWRHLFLTSEVVSNERSNGCQAHACVGMLNGISGMATQAWPWHPSHHVDCDGLEVSGSTPRPRSILISLQLAMGLVGNALLLAVALGTLVVAPVALHDATVAAGRLSGWIALGGVVAAYGYRRFRAGRGVSPQWTGLVGMAVLGLTACTIRGLMPLWGQSPEWGYRALMLGWAAYALLIALVTWWVAGLQTLPGAQGPPQALIRAAAVWVRIAGIAAVLLALKAAVWHTNEQLPAAAAIATASLAGATMAVWRRREGWAFAAALGTNLAASLVVWHFHQTLRFELWWLRLVQANAVASAAVALGWLAARRRLYQLRELNLGTSPLLAAQVGLAVVANGASWLVTTIGIVASPGEYSSVTMRLLAEASDAVGWSALLLAAAAVAWYCRHALPDKLVHVLGGLLLGAGTLAACRIGQIVNPPAWLATDDWLMVHSLMMAWTLAGFAVLGIGLFGRNVRLAAEGSDADAGEYLARWPVFGRHLVAAWTTAIGAIVVVLAVIHVADDPAGPWISGGTILATSAMAGTLAVWLRRPGYLAVSGLLLNLIGVVAWIAWDVAAWDLVSIAWLAQANAAAFAVAAAGWTAIALVAPRRVAEIEADTYGPTYRNVATRLAVRLLAMVVVVYAVAHALQWRPSPVVGPLDWNALAAAGLAVMPRLWGRHGHLAAAGLGMLTLSAVGLGLCSRELWGRAFCHAATLELTTAVAALAAMAAWIPRSPLKKWGLAFSGATAGLSSSVSQGNSQYTAGQASSGTLFHRAVRAGQLLRGLRLRFPDNGSTIAWLPAAWMSLIGLLAMACAWISMDFAFDPISHAAIGWPRGRMVGPLAGVLLLGAAILLAGQAHGTWRPRWQRAAMWLGLLFLVESGCVWLVPQGEAWWLWLHRGVLALAATVGMTLLTAFGLRRIVRPNSDWIDAARRMSTRFGGLAMGLLAAVLAQEAVHFDLLKNTPMAWPAIAVVGVALAALATGCLAMAAAPARDPLRLDERHRQIYVYLAEALLCLVGLHLWFTMPWLFERGLVRRFWMLIALGVAFLGAGLAEWFRRRAMPVLSKPLERTALLLPAVPAVGYWFYEATSARTWFLGHASPAVWLLAGVFYGMMAVRCRSVWLGALGVLTANTGLWTLWDRLDVQFIEHPQLWLIPLALAGLAAEHLNRERLGKARSVAVRYLSLTVIYVSSTADMFIAGIGTDLLTPLVLMLLAVGGALAGILLRIRSFLYLGVAFLVLDVGTMVWYASFQRHHWWVAALCGLALGIAVFVLVGVVEKRRNEILGAVERLKEWEE